MDTSGIQRHTLNSIRGCKTAIHVRSNAGTLLHGYDLFVTILTTLKVPSLVSNRLFPFSSRNVLPKLVSDYGDAPPGIHLLSTIVKLLTLTEDVVSNGKAHMYALDCNCHSYQ
jgi:hypothetical protein